MGRTLTLEDFEKANTDIIKRSEVNKKINSAKSTHMYLYAIPGRIAKNEKWKKISTNLLKSQKSYSKLKKLNDSVHEDKVPNKPLPKIPQKIEGESVNTLFLTPEEKEEKRKKEKKENKKQETIFYNSLNDIRNLYLSPEEEAFLGLKDLIESSEKEYDIKIQRRKGRKKRKERREKEDTSIFEGMQSLIANIEETYKKEEEEKETNILGGMESLITNAEEAYTIKEAYSTKIFNLEKEKAEYEKKINEINKKLDELQNKKMNILSTLIDLRQKRIDNQKSNDDEIADLEKKLGDIDKSIEAYKQLITLSQNRTESIQKEIEALDDKTKNLKSDNAKNDKEDTDKNKDKAGKSDKTETNENDKGEAVESKESEKNDKDIKDNKTDELPLYLIPQLLNLPDNVKKNIKEIIKIQKKNKGNSILNEGMLGKIEDLLTEFEASPAPDNKQKQNFLSKIKAKVTKPFVSSPISKLKKSLSYLETTQQYQLEHIHKHLNDTEKDDAFFVYKSEFLKNFEECTKDTLSEIYTDPEKLDDNSKALIIILSSLLRDKGDDNDESSYSYEYKKLREIIDKRSVLEEDADPESSNDDEKFELKEGPESIKILGRIFFIFLSTKINIESDEENDKEKIEKIKNKYNLPNGSFYSNLDAKTLIYDSEEIKKALEKKDKEAKNKQSEETQSKQASAFYSISSSDSKIKNFLKKFKEAIENLEGGIPIDGNDVKELLLYFTPSKNSRRVLPLFEKLHKDLNSLEDLKDIIQMPKQS